MKLTVVGGGSTYTPELVDGIARSTRLGIDELVLVDPAAERLATIGAVAARMLAREGNPAVLRVTGDLDEAVRDADVVLIQLRVGGQEARRGDETFPLGCGCVGQETTGAGGLAKALRTVPVVLDVAERVRRLAAPNAWIVDFTNPVGIVTRALLDAGHRAVGLCNVAIGFQRRFARVFDVEPDRVQLEHVGLNHLTWERKILVDGVDRLPEILESSLDEMSEETDLPGELIASLGAIPSYYLHYYYLTSRVLQQQREGRTRAEEVMEIEAGLLELYRDPTLDTKPKLLEERGGAFYSDAAAALVASLHAGTGDVQVVNVRNDGAIPDLPDDAVVEVSARVDRDGAHPIAVDPLAPEMAGLVQHAKAYERLAIDAAVTGDRGVALQALMANPLVGDYDVAGPMLEALLEANADRLPRFFPD
jgi:6-phospho-beta-glucosidase